jgi:hypothetical protein
LLEKIAISKLDSLASDIQTFRGQPEIDSTRLLPSDIWGQEAIGMGGNELSEFVGVT